MPRARISLPAGRVASLQRRATRPAARLRRSGIIIALFATIVAIGLAGCSQAATGFGRLTTTGQVQVITAQGNAHLAHSGEVLQAGDVVQVRTGQASIQLVPNGALQLRAGTKIALAATLRLTAGAVLVQPSGRTLKVAAEDATLVVPTGAAQLSMGSSAGDLVAKVYVATSQLDVAGNAATPIAAPREVDLTSETRFPVQPAPLRYQSADPWDRLYLAGAVAVSTELAAAADGFDAQVPAQQGDSPAFYQQLLPTLSSRDDFVSAFEVVVREQPGGAPASKPGNYLIASVIAMRGTRGAFVDRMNDELVFFAQGAPWGFVAYDQGVTDLAGVLNDVLTAVGRADLPFTGASGSQIAIGPAPASSSTPTTVPTTGATGPSTSTGTLTTPTLPGSPGHPPPSTTPTTAPLIRLPVPLLPGPLGAILNPLLDPLIQALNNILAGKG